MTIHNDTKLTGVAPRSRRCHRRASTIVAFRFAAALLAVVATALARIASADEFPSVIVLPGATSAEGIATGAGSTFYAGDFQTGDVYRGDLRSGQVELFIDAPIGRMAVGLKADVGHGLLFVAGGFTGQAYI